MRIGFAIFAALAFAGATLPARAQFIDTTWTVTGFDGEAWFIDPAAAKGKTQTFDKGFAEGLFFNCDFAGLSATYTTYAPDDFFANPEFVLFKPVEEAVRMTGGRVYVHRITCEGQGDPVKRQVIYPFVTSDDHETAYYLFEGGVFTLDAAK